VTTTEDMKCEAMCTLKGITASCHDRIRWSRHHETDRETSPCEAAYVVMMSECAAVCGTCDMDEAVATCKEDWVQDEKARAQKMKEELEEEPWKQNPAIYHDPLEMEEHMHEARMKREEMTFRQLFLVGSPVFNGPRRSLMPMLTAGFAGLCAAAMSVLTVHRRRRQAVRRAASYQPILVEVDSLDM